MRLPLLRPQDPLTITDIKYLFILLFVLPTMLMCAFMITYPPMFTFMGFTLSCFFALYCVEDDFNDQDRPDNQSYCEYDYL